MAKKATLRLNPNLQSQVEQMLAPGLRAYQEELNQVLDEHAGQPVDDIHEALVEVTARHGLKPNVEELRKLAEKHAG